MKRTLPLLSALLLALSLVRPLHPVWGAQPKSPQKGLPLPSEVFAIDGRTAFVILPAAENRLPNRPTPWVWYAPALPGLPEARETWMFERFLAAGIAVAGVDVGESYGSPQGRAGFSALYRELVERRVREVLLQRGLGPDFSYTSPGKPADLDYIHRRTLDADIYFVSNTQLEDAEADCLFRVTRRPAQLWFPDTGEIQSLPDCESVAGGSRLKLRLPPAGSVFVVFGGAAKPTIAAAKPPANALPPLEIPGPWEVQFPPNLGAPPSRVFEQLVSWTAIPDEGVKYFSGTATYLKEFEVPASMLAPGNRLELDLGQLRNVAEATLNDQPLGIRWKPPFRYEVTGLVRPGKNTLAVRITNVWANRLAGDAKLPPDKRVTRLTQKVGLSGLLEAGLLGPVRLLRSADH